jgi:hypothetical protein
MIDPRIRNRKGSRLKSRMEIRLESWETRIRSRMGAG